VAAVADVANRPIVIRIREHAIERPAHTAIAIGKKRLSYAELWRQTAAAREWLISRGIGHGDRVLISTDSRDPYFPAAYFGTQLAGAIAVPIDFRSTAERIESRSRFVTARIALVDRHLTDFRMFIGEEQHTAAKDEIEQIPAMSDLAEIMFTSGTTGKPKGVTLSHQNIAESAQLIRSFVGNDADDVEVVTVPLTHSFGLGRLRATILAGGTIVIIPGLVFPQLTFRALAEHRATGLACVPSGMRLFLAKMSDNLAAFAGQLKYLEMGSAVFRPEEKEQVRNLLPHTRLCMHYGLTEASRSAFLEFHEDRKHLDSVGKPSPGIEIKVVPQADCPPGDAALGLLHIRAPTVMVGYWNDDKLTSTVLERETGWLNSGDLGWIDDAGYLHLAGRADEVINCGGAKFMPDELERYAEEFANVMECGCTAVADPGGVLGDIPLLCVTTSGPVDTGALAKHVRKRFAYDLPTMVVRVVNTLPRTVSGKLIRRQLPAL
jgi:long-chain acyl-CoA synthetase